jgi:hypothetical protein
LVEDLESEEIRVREALEVLPQQTQCFEVCYEQIYAAYHQPMQIAEPFLVLPLAYKQAFRKECEL